MILRYVKLTGSEKWFEYTSRAMTRSLMSGDHMIKMEIISLSFGTKRRIASLFDRVNNFKDLLYRGIKRTLNSGRKDDPDVRVEVDVLEDVFNNMLGNVVDGKWERGKLVHVIPTNRMLDNVLGLKWDEQIVNIRGDFCYIAEGTVNYWLTKKSTIVEYKLIGGKYVKSEIEGCCMVVFTFVCGTGNRIQYEQRG